MSLTDRLLGRLGYQRFQPYTPEEIAAMWGNSLGAGWMPTTTLNNKQEPIGSGFTSLVMQAYATNPVVFACVNARVQLFSEARFQFQKMSDGVPGDLTNGPSTYLRLINTPWPGGTTRHLLKDMLLDADLAGNAFVLHESNGLRRLRPDWVTIVAGNPDTGGTTWDLDTQVLGYVYTPDGPGGGKPPIYLQRQQVAHFKSTHDPLSRFRGMPWLLPVLKDLSSDGAATDFKLKYFENAATPNLAIHFDQTMALQQAKDFIELFKKEHEGSSNAFKTLFLGGGATAMPVGSNLKDSTFTDVQGKGELRIASAGGVPPIIIGLAGGLDAATYSNYGQARRAFADLTMRPLWGDVSGSLETITSVPSNSRLWYDDRHISFTQEDEKDDADIQAAQASAIRQLVDGGYDPESVVDAITAGDLNRLEHTGLYSVQLQPPGTTAAPATTVPGLAPKTDAVPAALMNSGQPAGEVRCSGCDRLLAEIATAPYRFTCGRCKTTNESGTLIAA